MMIHNNPQDKGKVIADLREAIEHRATWMYLLIEEARKEGLGVDFARRAITACGCLHGKTKFTPTEDLLAFAQEFANPKGAAVFEMAVDAQPEELKIDFHYCPLVSAWQKLTTDEKKIAELCDIAMEGDRGIASAFKSFTFSLGKTIAQGNRICEIRFQKRPSNREGAGKR
ncbi:MAG: L-2-amino-thiazoline-4-carboxylic acid hydrolase [Treponema sp.]|nr:L-2-amino-thiazoline-4-carboxylic acid hydrolase [Treponema sp.]